MRIDRKFAILAGILTLASQLPSCKTTSSSSVKAQPSSASDSSNVACRDPRSPKGSSMQRACLNLAEWLTENNVDFGAIKVTYLKDQFNVDIGSFIEVETPDIKKFVAKIDDQPAKFERANKDVKNNNLRWSYQDGSSLNWVDVILTPTNR